MGCLLGASTANQDLLAKDWPSQDMTPISPYHYLRFLRHILDHLGPLILSLMDFPNWELTPLPHSLLHSFFNEAIPQRIRVRRMDLKLRNVSLPHYHSRNQPSFITRSQHYSLLSAMHIQAVVAATMSVPYMSLYSD